MIKKIKKLNRLRLKNINFYSLDITKEKEILNLKKIKEKEN